MFAQTDEVDAKFIGQNRLIHHVAQNLIHRFRLAVRAKADVAKSIQSKFYAGHDPAFPVLADRISLPCRKEKLLALHRLCA